MTIQLPPPGRSGRRAARLAAAMPTTGSDPIMANAGASGRVDHADGYRIGGDFRVGSA